RPHPPLLRDRRDEYLSAVSQVPATARGAGGRGVRGRSIAGAGKDLLTPRAALAGVHRGVGRQRLNAETNRTLTPAPQGRGDSSIASPLGRGRRARERGFFYRLSLGERPTRGSAAGEGRRCHLFSECALGSQD